jgi:hypothetical protein
MGVPAILARFAPLEPVVVFGCLRAEPWDAGVPVAERVAGAAAGLPGLAAIIALDNGSLPASERTVPQHRLGKRSEAAARDAVNGRPARNRDALQNPECLDAIAKHPVVRASAAIKASRGPAPGRGAIPGWCAAAAGAAGGLRARAGRLAHQLVR